MLMPRYASCALKVRNLYAQQRNRKLLPNVVKNGTGTTGLRAGKSLREAAVAPTPNPLRQRDRYRAYLVRLWQDGPQSPWRASTQCVQTGEKRIFADLDSLCTFLHAQTKTVGDPPGATEDAHS